MKVLSAATALDEQERRRSGRSPAAGSTSTFIGSTKADSFNSGAGADTIRYTSAAQSTSAAYDVVSGFDTSSDSFFWSQSITFDGTVNALLRTTTLDDNLATAFGSIAANHAAIVEASGGNLSGQMFLLINDGTAGYQPGDLVVRLAGTDPATFLSANFTDA